ncbi:hypothetical protein ACHQM5_013969 [Ranunculus cassubicifolius]
MLSQYTKRFTKLLHHHNQQQQIRYARTGTSPSSSYTRKSSKFRPPSLKKIDEKSEWWAVDGEMHEIGENVPPRERFVIPRDNLPNKRRKQMREQFMRRTRLVLKESEHEPWCKRYMELYQELRENWERLYWDEGYSKKLAKDHANYESAEDDDFDFSPYRRRPSSRSEQVQDQGFGGNRPQNDTWERVGRIRDKFEYDKEKRMGEKAFAPMHRGTTSSNYSDPGSKYQQFDAQRYFPDSDED